MVQDGKVQIVDEFTGRILYGRRYSEGLHQAIEAKERIKIAQRNRTLATITFQNYFRMYGKLAGMTGTADTEAQEFGKIYNLDVVVIPTNRPVVRADADDEIYLTEEEKLTAICDSIGELHKKGQPVLVGTISIEKSEKLSRMLIGRGVRHEVLNAKNHAREAMIIAEAGTKGSVTIATNMAGRGHRHQAGRKSRVQGAKEGRDPGKRGDLPQGVRGRVPRLAVRLSGGDVAGRSSRSGHGTSRGAAHRQPASRPFGPAGRSRLLAFLYFPGRRPDAAVRRREHQGPHVADGHEGWRAHRPPLAEQVHRARAEEGGGAQLRGQKAPAGVRRRAQRAAEVHLLAAGRDHLRPQSEGQGHRHRGGALRRDLRPLPRSRARIRRHGWPLSWPS